MRLTINYNKGKCNALASTAVVSFLRAGEALESLGHDKEQNKLKGRRGQRQKETFATGPRFFAVHSGMELRILIDAEN